MEMLLARIDAQDPDFKDSEDGSRTFDATNQDPVDEALAELEQLMLQRAEANAAARSSEAADDRAWDEATKNTAILPLPVLVVAPDDSEQSFTNFTLSLVRPGWSSHLIGILAPEPKVRLKDRVLEIGRRRFTEAFGTTKAPGWLHVSELHAPSREAFDACTDTAIRSRLSYRAFLAGWARKHLAESLDGTQNVLVREANAHLKVGRRHYVSRIEAKRVLLALRQRSLARLKTKRPLEKKSPPPSGLRFQVVAPFLERSCLARGSNKETLEMLANGVEKDMLPSPDPSVLAPLYIRFPNFHEALDKVSKQLHLLKRSGKAVPLKLRPLLLAGGSGVGKSHFAWQLAKTLGASAREVDFATATAGFVLAGASPQWADAKHGMVFDELIYGRYGNPVFIGNEIDKSSQEGVRFPPVGPLYTLLEPETAHRFVDEFAETAIDASYVSWVMTANDIQTIPGPLLLRMDVVQVPAPTSEQLLVIGQNIYRDLLEKAPWGQTFPPELDPAVLSRVVRAGAPRQMRNALMDALGQAAIADADCVAPEHVQTTQPQRRSIGF